MKQTKRWLQAQHSKKVFWNNVARDGHSVLRVLASNADKAREVRAALPANTTSALEIGNGPFRLGIMGFLAEIPTRVTVDSVPPFPSVFRYPSKASFGTISRDTARRSATSSDRVRSFRSRANRRTR